MVEDRRNGLAKGLRCPAREKKGASLKEMPNRVGNGNSHIQSQLTANGVESLKNERDKGHSSISTKSNWLLVPAVPGDFHLQNLISRLRMHGKLLVISNVHSPIIHIIQYKMYFKP